MSFKLQGPRRGISNILRKYFYRQYGLYLRAFTTATFGYSPRSGFSLVENNKIRRDKMRRVQNCSAFRDRSRNQWYSAAALHRLTRDQEASRAGRYSEGICGLAVRSRNR